MKAALTKAVTENRPMHAYLFCGAEGSGKMTAAKLFANELVGRNRQKAERGVHQDIIILAPEKNKKLITVDQVRSMRRDAFVNPGEALRKIYIIDGVQLMNEAGQNALLTVLEQPPSFAIFILLSESREKVLPTVISRCSCFEMEYVEAEDGAKLLSSRHPEISYDRLIAAMNAAQGNIGLAEKLACSEQFEKHIKCALSVAYAMAKKDEYTTLAILSAMDKDELTEFLPILCMLLRDITVCRLTGSGGTVFKESVLQNSAKFDKINVNTLYNSVTACQNAIELISANVNASLITASLVIQLCGGKQID